MRKKAVIKLWWPRYWFTWLWVGLMWVLARLPRAIRNLFGRGLGQILNRFARSRSHIVKTNIELCFPHMDVAERQSMVKRCCTAHGLGIADTAVSWFGGSSHWPDLRLKNAQLLDVALKQDCGVLLVGAHFTSIDICSLLFSQMYPMSAVYRPLKNPVMHWCMERAMRRFESAIHRDDVRTLVRTLKAGGMVWYAPDQDYGRRHSVFAPFFGVPAATITATSRLVRMSGCKVVAASHYRLDNGRCIELVFSELSGHWPTGDDVADCTEVNRVIEKGILVDPSQYMWTHRRFKTRPQGEARPY